MCLRHRLLCALPFVWCNAALITPLVGILLPIAKSSHDIPNYDYNTRDPLTGYLAPPCPAPAQVVVRRRPAAVLS